MIFEGYRWDAVLLNEIWRLAKSEFWETHHKHIYVDAGKYDHNHGVGILLNKKWRHHNNDRGQPSKHHAGERVLPPLGICRSSHWKMYRTIEKHTSSLQKEHTDCWRRLQRWFEALGLVSSESVLDRTHSKRVAKEEIGWSNGWWYRISQHSTRCTETLGKRTTHRSRTGTEQQIDYILIKRRHLKYTKTLKPKTWSTWAVTTDVSWQHFAINTKKEYTPMMQTKTNVEKTKPHTNWSKR